MIALTSPRSEYSDDIKARLFRLGLTCPCIVSNLELRARRTLTPWIALSFEFLSLSNEQRNQNLLVKTRLD